MLLQCKATRALEHWQHHQHAAEAPSVWQHSAVSSRQQPTLPRYRLYASPTPSHARQHDASCHSAFLLSYLSKSEIQTKPPT